MKIKKKKDNKIENIRKSLFKVVNKKGLKHSDVLKVSQQLDRRIIKYYREKL
jgi:hypothetical protein